MLRAVVGFILDWLFGKVVEMYRIHKARKEADAAIDEKMKDQADKVINSETDQEDIDAAREILTRK